MKRWKWKNMVIWLAVVTALVISGSFSAAALPDQEPMTVHYLDVGQGDCTLIVCGDQTMLIDAGGEASGTAVQLYLMKQGISRLDYVIATHYDEDHIGGLDVILTKFDCETMILPGYEKDTAAYRNLWAAMEYRNYKNTPPKVGETYPLGDGEFTILSPDRQRNCR